MSNEYKYIYVPLVAHMIENLYNEIHDTQIKEFYRTYDEKFKEYIDATKVLITQETNPFIYNGENVLTPEKYYKAQVSGEATSTHTERRDGSSYDNYYYRNHLLIDLTRKNCEKFPSSYPITKEKYEELTRIAKELDAILRPRYLLIKPDGSDDADEYNRAFNDMIFANLDKDLIGNYGSLRLLFYELIAIHYYNNNNKRLGGDILKYTNTDVEHNNLDLFDYAANLDALINGANENSGIAALGKIASRNSATAFEISRLNDAKKRNELLLKPYKIL
jgi:hypothetical protein